MPNDPEDLGGAGEGGLFCGGGGLDEAFLGAPVTAGMLAVQSRAIAGDLGGDAGQQAGLVGLEGHHVAGAGLVQQGGGGVLGVQRVQGEDHRGRVVPGCAKIVQQCCHHGDFVGLVGDLALGQHDRDVVGGRGQQVRRRLAGCAGSAHGLAIDRDRHPLAVLGAGAISGGGPDRYRRLQLDGIDPGGDAPDGGLARCVYCPGQAVWGGA